MIGLGVLVGVTPFVISIIIESKIANEKEEMFLEFARNLFESVKTGASISKSIINLKNKSMSPRINIIIDERKNQYVKSF